MLLGDGGELSVDVFGKRQELVALVLEGDSHGSDAVRGEVLANLHLPDDEVEEFTARGGVGAGQREHVLAHPPGEYEQVVDELNGCSLFLPRDGQFLGEGLPFALGSGPPHLPFQFLPGSDATVGAVLEVGGHLSHLAFGVEDVPATRDARPGLCLSGAQALSGVGHGVLKVEAALGEIEKMDCPGDGVAAWLLGEEVAVGGEGVRPNEDGISLEDLVVRSDPDLREVFLAIDEAGLLDGGHDDVVDRSVGDLGVEDVPDEVLDTSVGAVAIEDRGEDDLPDPLFGDRDGEEDPLVIFLFGTEGGVECAVGLVDLRVDELSAYFVLPGQIVQRLGASHARKGKELALRRGHLRSGRGLGLHSGSWIADNIGNHAWLLQCSGAKYRCYRQLTGMVFTGIFSSNWRMGRSKRQIRA